ncbi:hypothetical protein B0H16DRAFT_1776383 [Mycena metata]|uniref:Uncharacterized protein n=1 Tax=Mycena metata TaxID=1033252 RepID=A0AAD7HWP7_9AGAR|nr:hypothetical protein B0H16DRAFT_1776383 [Mycena metata]
MASVTCDQCEKYSTLRFLLLSNICSIIFVAYPSLSVTPSRRALTFIVCSLITLHHILVTFPWRIRALGLIDFVLPVIEIGFFVWLVSLFCATALGTVSGCDHHVMQGRVITTATVFLLGRLYARSPAVHSVVNTPRPVHFKAPSSGRGDAASIVFARAVIINQSVCAPAILLPFIAFVRLHLGGAAIRARVHGNNDVGFPTVFLARSRTISFNTSASNIHVSALSANGNTNNSSRVDRDSFGITTTALVILECPYRWPMSIPADIPWLRVSVKADDRYGCDNRTDPRYCINITMPGLGLTGLYNLLKQ